MPNEPLDEIEARWRDCEQDEFTDLDPAEQALWVAIEDLHTLIAMVRARDRVVEAARWLINEAQVDIADGTASREEKALYAALAALDTPPAQEQKR